MSYDIKLSKVCDNKIVWEDHIVESDYKTVILGKPIISTNMNVRINDFKRPKDFMNEFLMKEDVSQQITGLNRSFFVSQGPIYNGLKTGTLATKPEEVIVRVKVIQEDVSEQFSGIENYFYTQGRPLMKSNNYDFNNYADESDIIITVNGQSITENRIDNPPAIIIPNLKYQLSAYPIVNLSEQVFIDDVLQQRSNYTINDSTGVLEFLTTITGSIKVAYTYDNEIQDIDIRSGRIQLKKEPSADDVILITYFYQARVKELDAIQSRITIKELPKVGQEVKISYYSRQSDGWYVKNSEVATIERSQDIVFYKNRNTNRFFIEKEHVTTDQITDDRRSFFVLYSPLLPLFQVFSSTIDETLNNAVRVYVNGVRVQIATLLPKTGKITLHTIIKKTDVVEVSYWYEADLIPDRISVDYYVSSIYCDKCSKYSDLLEYSIDKLGVYEKVFDENKLIQDLKKITRTILGSDPVANWYGTEFEKIIGSKVFPDITKTKILNEIVTALSKLKSAQIQQEEYQTVTDAEFLDYIRKSNVQQSISDPSLFTADIDVVTQSGRLVPVTEVVQTKG